jgi:hypothetical protein
MPSYAVQFETVTVPAHLPLVSVRLAGALAIGRSLGSEVWFRGRMNSWRRVAGASLVDAWGGDGTFAVLSTDRVLRISADAGCELDLSLGHRLGEYGEASLIGLGGDGQWLATSVVDAGLLLALVSEDGLVRTRILETMASNCAAQAGPHEGGVILSVGDGPGTWEHWLVDSSLRMSSLDLPPQAVPVGSLGGKVAVLCDDSLTRFDEKGERLDTVIAQDCRTVYDLGWCMVVDGREATVVIEKASLTSHEDRGLREMLLRVASYGGRCTFNSSTGQICGMAGPQVFLGARLRRELQ